MLGLCAQAVRLYLEATATRVSEVRQKRRKRPGKVKKKSHRSRRTHGRLPRSWPLKRAEASQWPVVAALGAQNTTTFLAVFTATSHSTHRFDSCLLPHFSSVCAPSRAACLPVSLSLSVCVFSHYTHSWCCVVLLSFSCPIPANLWRSGLSPE